MNLRQLQQFVTLAETGNFHRAAEKLFMAQPPLSVSIRKLEGELACELFERTTTGVLLTAAGHAMLADARLALAHAQRCRQAVQDAREGEGGVVRLGFVGTATFALLPALIPSLRQHLPKIRLELTEATTSEILQGLLERRFDAGLLRYPLPDPAGFDVLALERDAFVLAVSTHSALAAHDAIALSAAAHEPFIMYPHGPVPGLAALAQMRCQFSGFVPRVTQEAMQVQTILSLVAAGLGVALVAGVAQRVLPAGVKCLRLTDNPAGFHLGIALARLAGEPNRVVQRFAEHALHCASAAHAQGGS
ncbi:LysR family transcriptional regulator [Comamonas faecalis]|uniref:LysR family transcriptional regulator n=1 Tax=Comamonas faecalis TaxID=1387849 RepID=A0ABP7QN61_9BURK